MTLPASGPSLDWDSDDLVVTDYNIGRLHIYSFFHGTIFAKVWDKCLITCFLELVLYCLYKGINDKCIVPEGENDDYDDHKCRPQW